MNDRSTILSSRFVSVDGPRNERSYAEMESVLEPQAGATRSRARRNSLDQASDRMLGIGRDLLRERDFDQVTVKEIAEASHSSVGSFYNSFGDKDKYFTCLIEEMIKRRKAAAQKNFEQPFQRLPEALALGAIHNFAEYQGLIRSAIRKHLLGISTWTPIAKMSGEFIDQYRALCSVHLGRPLKPSEGRRIAFAFSWLYGMLMQRVMQINDIHQSDIDQPHFARYTVLNFSRLLDDALEPDEDH